MADPTIQDVLNAISALSADVQVIKTKVNDLHPIKTKVDDILAGVQLTSHNIVIRPGEVPPLP